MKFHNSLLLMDNPCFFSDYYTGLLLFSRSIFCVPDKVVVPCADTLFLLPLLSIYSIGLGTMPGSDNVVTRRLIRLDIIVIIYVT